MRLVDCLPVIFLGLLSLSVLILAQDQSGFISIDCGLLPETSSYNDETTDIKYISDANFIDSGISKSISPAYGTSTLEQQFYNVRSFPEGLKNCYTLNPALGKHNKYMIRGSFMYGNYDGLAKPPQFDLYLGANIWDSVILDNATSLVIKEIIHIPSSDHIHVCLVNTGQGTPFISVLELRLLKNNTYETPYESLMRHTRWNMGATTNSTIRYKDDLYDRIWRPNFFVNWTALSTSQTVDASVNNGFQPSPKVMSTAGVPINASEMIFYMEPKDPKSKYYFYMHYAEVEEIEANQFREFDISVNGKTLYSSFSPRYLLTDTLIVEKPLSGVRLEFTLSATKKSTLPPIINGLEVYVVNEFSQYETEPEDAEAVMSIKLKYEVKRSWQGDPCMPKAYQWDGLNCSYNTSYPPRITYLNLSSSGLTGEIALDFSSLSMIQYLDLSNNSLTGTVPDFLSNLQFLRVLNLEANMLTGFLPGKLLERSNDGSLSLRVGGNTNLCSSPSCQKKTQKNKFVIPLIASVALLLVVAITVFLWWKLKLRKQIGDGKLDGNVCVKNGPYEMQNRVYKYSDVVKFTNNFERVLGKGGFGIVYYGFLDGVPVAVKMLSAASAQGDKEFQAEVKILVRVHHKNLTALIGYCNEGTHKGLIYEYMANGNLGTYLTGKNTYNLSWENRLQIASEAAQGLEYLHHGCKPPIVHRDVKSANILLNEKFEAKLADFGLSRNLQSESRPYVSTVIAGTMGYLDPECQITNQVNEKSDVYSFGVVLLEIVTGRRIITPSSSQRENIHISDWVSSMLSKGDIKKIVDPKIRNNFNTSSAWKVVELALACSSRTSSIRPTMRNVVDELNQCFTKDVARKDEDSSASDKKSAKVMSMNMNSRLKPRAR